MTEIMIVNDTVQLATWQKELANAVKNPLQLLQLLDIKPENVPLSVIARNNFPMLVPLPFVKKMKIGDINDPLLRQVLPVTAEELVSEGYCSDPLGEHEAAIPGVLHKYKSRILLILKSGCAVNCRYCFRRHFPYKDNNINKNQVQDILRYLQEHPDVNEVILSGGEPLMSKDEFLQYLFDSLASLPQLTRVRIHTRFPVMIPARITNALCAMLKNSRFKVVVVFHINHANEIDKPFMKATAKLREAGVQLLNQTVLLKDVNDDGKTLIDLSEKLFSADILPYYLFLLDKVQGAQHFDLPEREAQLLIKEMNLSLPGYLVPKLCREIAGEKSKTIINSL